MKIDLVGGEPGVGGAQRGHSAHEPDVLFPGVYFSGSRDKRPQFAFSSADVGSPLSEVAKSELIVGCGLFFAGTGGDDEQLHGAGLEIRTMVHGLVSSTVSGLKTTAP